MDSEMPLHAWCALSHVIMFCSQRQKGEMFNLWAPQQTWLWHTNMNWWIAPIGHFKYLSCRWMVRFIYLLVRRDMYFASTWPACREKRVKSTVNGFHCPQHKAQTQNHFTGQQSELFSSFIYAPVCGATVNLKMGLTFKIKPFNIAFESYSVDVLNFIVN